MEECDTPVSVSRIVTVALGTTAPLGSITVPLIEPAPVVCAIAATPVHTSSPVNTNPARLRWRHKFESFIIRLSLRKLKCFLRLGKKGKTRLHRGAMRAEKQKTLVNLIFFTGQDDDWSILRGLIRRSNCRNGSEWPNSSTQPMSSPIKIA
jgi:hypothetical protein